MEKSSIGKSAIGSGVNFVMMDVRDSQVGDGTTGTGAKLYNDTKVGNDCALWFGADLDNTTLGDKAVTGSTCKGVNLGMGAVSEHAGSSLKGAAFPTVQPILDEDMKTVKEVIEDFPNCSNIGAGTYADGGTSLFTVFTGINSRIFGKVAVYFAGFVKGIISEQDCPEVLPFSFAEGVPQSDGTIKVVRKIGWVLDTEPAILETFIQNTRKLLPEGRKNDVYKVIRSMLLFGQRRVLEEMEKLGRGEASVYTQEELEAGLASYATALKKPKWKAPAEEAVAAKKPQAAKEIPAPRQPTTLAQIIYEKGQAYVDQKWHNVTFADPASIVIDESVEIWPDTVIGPNSVLLGNTSIGQFCKIENSTLVNAKLENKVELKNSVAITTAAETEKFNFVEEPTAVKPADSLDRFGVNQKETIIREGAKLTGTTVINSDIGQYTNADGSLIKHSIVGPYNNLIPGAHLRMTKTGPVCLLSAESTRTILGTAAAVSPDVYAAAIAPDEFPIVDDKGVYTVLKGIPNPISVQKGTKFANYSGRFGGRKGLTWLFLSEIDPGTNVLCKYGRHDPGMANLPAAAMEKEDITVLLPFCHVSGQVWGVVLPGTIASTLSPKAQQIGAVFDEEPQLVERMMQDVVKYLPDGQKGKADGLVEGVLRLGIKLVAAEIQKAEQGKSRYTLEQLHKGLEIYQRHLASGRWKMQNGKFAAQEAAAGRLANADQIIAALNAYGEDPAKWHNPYKRTAAELLTNLAAKIDTIRGNLQAAEPQDNDVINIIMRGRTVNGIPILDEHNNVDWFGFAPFNKGDLQFLIDRARTKGSGLMAMDTHAAALPKKMQVSQVEGTILDEIERTAGMSDRLRNDPEINSAFVSAMRGQLDPDKAAKKITERTEGLNFLYPNEVDVVTADVAKIWVNAACVRMAAFPGVGQRGFKAGEILAMDKAAAQASIPNDQILQHIEKELRVDDMEMRGIIAHARLEMDKGLRGEASSLAMIPSFVDAPTGNEKGIYFGIDYGGTNNRVLTIELKGNRTLGEPVVRSYPIPAASKTGTPEQLFDLIADCVVNFMKEHGMDPAKPLPVGFTFSFEVAQTAINKGILKTWSKDFNIPGALGRDVVKLLNVALARKGLRTVKVAALCNDTVGTLEAAAYTDPYCDVGGILGTGTNFSCRLPLKDIPKWQGPTTSSGQMIVNMESGGYRPQRTTDYDGRVDAVTKNRGEHIFEKMISGMYLGEVARNIFLDLIARGMLFDGRLPDTLSVAWGFKTDYGSIIEVDDSPNLDGIDKVLKDELKIGDSTLTDRQMIKKVWEMVYIRAARLSAAFIAATVTKMDPGLEKPHTIAIDGSLFEKHPPFKGAMEAALTEILGEKASKIKFVLAKDGSGKGAAIIAAVAAAAQPARPINAEVAADLKANAEEEHRVAMVGITVIDLILNRRWEELPDWLRDKLVENSLVVEGNIPGTVDEKGKLIERFLRDKLTQEQRDRLFKEVIIGGPASSTARVFGQVTRDGTSRAKLISNAKPDAVTAGLLEADLAGPGVKVDVSGITESSKATAMTLIFELGKGKRSFLHNVGASAGLTLKKFKEAVDAGTFDNMDVVEFGGVELSGLMKDLPAAIRILRAREKTISRKFVIALDTVVDPAHIWKKLKKDNYAVLKEIDILTTNMDEAGRIYGDWKEKDPEKASAAAKSCTYEDILKFFTDHDSKAVFLKIGGAGSIIKTAKDSVFGKEVYVHIPVLYGVENVSGTGTGDAYSAGLVYGKAYGWDPIKTALFATVLGGLCLEHKGGTLGAANDFRSARLSMEDLKDQQEVQASLTGRLTVEQSVQSSRVLEGLSEAAYPIMLQGELLMLLVRRGEVYNNVIATLKQRGDTKKIAEIEEAIKRVEGVIAAFNQFEVPVKATPQNCEVELITSGRVNLANYQFKLKVAPDKTLKFIVQQPNDVFEFEAIDKNIRSLQDAQALARNDTGREFPKNWKNIRCLNVRGSKEILYYTDPQKPNSGFAWRIMEFVEGKVFNSFEEVSQHAEAQYRKAKAAKGEPIDKEEMQRYKTAALRKVAESTGRAMADFRWMLEHKKLEGEPLPGYHNTPNYVKQLEVLKSGETGVVAPSWLKDNAPKTRMIPGIRDTVSPYAVRVNYMFGEFEKRQALAHAVDGAGLADQHNDTKLNNFVFDPETLEVRCLIDLDTLQSGRAVDDFGDAGRLIINLSGEDPRNEAGERDINKVSVNIELLTAMADSYLDRIEYYYGSAEREKVKQYIYDAVRVILYELSMRFFTSFITELVEPDSKMVALDPNVSEAERLRRYGTYFGRRKIEPEDKNLWAAEVQMRTLQEYEKKLQYHFGIMPPGEAQDLGAGKVSYLLGGTSVSVNFLSDPDMRLLREDQPAWSARLTRILVPATKEKADGKPAVQEPADVEAREALKMGVAVALDKKHGIFAKKSPAGNAVIVFKEQTAQPPIGLVDWAKLKDARAIGNGIIIIATATKGNAPDMEIDAAIAQLRKFGITPGDVRMAIFSPGSGEGFGVHYIIPTIKKLSARFNAALQASAAPGPVTAALDNLAAIEGSV
ncbi:MAG: PfkB family carbohydrate kinase [Candidatus Omnitrophica bacterium]|nr:PfkB family carbohydrate kinase [Candidatus Omnitrophota bacterium]